MVTGDRTRVAELIDAIGSASTLLRFGEISIELCDEAALSNAELEELQANCDNVRIERTAEGVLRVGGDLVGSQIGSKIGCETPSRPGLLPKVTECHVVL